VQEHTPAPSSARIGRRGRSATETQKSSTAVLALLALGVVFGDIGTSPLYAVKETFAPGRGIALTAANILGGLLAIFWSLMFVVSLKYVSLIMRADNRGEGGIMALLALASSAVKARPRLEGVLFILGITGAALFYGDAVLTPAISVLSAIEGLEVGTSAFKPLVVPLAIGVLVALFVLQRRGTAVVGALFGPVCAAWFVALGAAGVWNIVNHPGVLAALHPGHALGFLTGHGFASFVVLGAVLLAFTGAEALYADMGHFGKRAVRLAWFGLVLPALVLNYFGQGALLIADPQAIEHPFYRAFPGWALYPMVALATAATVIASQATISGAYSVTQQAIQLGLLPRMNVVHTSSQAIGQVYVPLVNWLLLAAVLGAVLGFGSSSALASAYGVAVMGTMLVDTCLTFFVVRFGWRYPLALCVLATGAFLLFDLVFLGSALLKVAEGGWFPMLVALLLFAAMTTWRRGRQILLARLRQDSVPLAPFLEMLLREPPQRVPGTAIFMTATADATPHALLHNLNHNKVLHERVAFMTVETAGVPWVPAKERLTIVSLGHGCFRITVRYGFRNRPDVQHALRLAARQGFAYDPMQTSFFLSRETIVATAAVRNMAPWRERFFATMVLNAGNVTNYFNIPANRVIELGTRVEI